MPPIPEAIADHLAASPRRRPVSTYRLQLHKGFTLAEARAILPYLDDLGIGDVYLSPFLAARPGSTHGYDVIDHGRINPEIGDEAPSTHDSPRDLADRKMGRVLDIVPNHMGVNGPNPYWLDVLEIGLHSPYAAFFDIDWHPVKDELEGRVLLPILEDQYGRVLENGVSSSSSRSRTAFRSFIRYQETNGSRSRPGRMRSILAARPRATCTQSGLPVRRSRRSWSC